MRSLIRFLGSSLVFRLRKLDSHVGETDCLNLRLMERKDEIAKCAIAFKSRTNGNVVLKHLNTIAFSLALVSMYIYNIVYIACVLCRCTVIHSQICMNAFSSVIIGTP